MKTEFELARPLFAERLRSRIHFAHSPRRVTYKLIHVLRQRCFVAKLFQKILKTIYIYRRHTATDFDNNGFEMPGTRPSVVFNISF